MIILFVEADVVGAGSGQVGAISGEPDLSDRHVAQLHAALNSFPITLLPQSHTIVYIEIEIERERKKWE